MATKLGTLTLDLVARISSFTQGMQQASTTAEREMQRVENSVVTVDGLIKKLAVTAGAAFSVSQVSGFADSYIGLQNRLKLVTDTQVELNKAMSDTFLIAQSTGTAWDSTAQVYQRFADNAKKLGITMDETASLTETVSKAISISGGSVASAEAALMQFGQALASNVLRGEEFNSISEQAPGLLKAIAIGLGVNTGELRKMAGEGKLTGEVLVKSLAAAKVPISEMFGKTDFMGGTGWTLIENAAVKTVGEFSKATGASQALFDSLKFVSENMDAVTKSMGISAAFIMGTYLPALISSIGAGYAKTKQIIEQTAIQYAAVNAERVAAASSLAQAEAQLVNTQSTLAALAAEKALEVQRLQAQINAVGRMASATRMAQLRQIEVQVTAELTVAETALAAARARTTAASAASVGVGRAALGILGGPVGMGVTLAAVAAGYLLMKDGAEKATASVNIQGQSVGELVKKYRELNTIQRDNEAKALTSQIEELSLKYRVASSDLFSFMEALPISDEKIATFRKLNSQLSQGKISGDDYYKAIKNVNILTDEQLDKIRNLIGGYVDGKEKFNEAEAAQKAFASAASDTTSEIKKQAVEAANLSDELKKLLSANADSTYKNHYIAEMVKGNVDPKAAEMLYELRKAEGLLGTGKKLSDASLKSFSERWRSEQELNKTLEERTKVEERNKKLIEAQGNALKLNAKVAENAAKYNFASIEARNNLPKGLIAATVMQESKGNIYNSRGGILTSPSGAQGPAQFMPDTAKRFNVDVTSMKSSAEGVAKYYVYLLDLFEGDLDKAISAYHAGEGNVQRGTNIGPINRKYVKNIKGYMGGASGVAFTEDYSFDDWLKEQEKFSIEREKREKEMAAKQKEIENGVASEAVRIRSKLVDDIKNINKAEFTPEKTAEMIAEYQKRADIDIQIAEAAHSDKLSAYSDYMKSEEQLLTDSFARRQRDLKLDLTLTADEYKQASLHLESQRAKELQKVRWHALEVRQAMDDQIKSLSANADNIFAKATMSPQDYAKWALDNDRSNAQVDLKNERVKVEQSIMTSDAYSTDDDRYEALKQAHREYRDGLYAIDLQYDQQVKDLSKGQYESQLGIWASLLGQAQNTWSQMTQAVKDSEGEQSGSFKAMFLMQQSMAFASAIVSAHLAAVQTTADITLPFIGKVPAASAILAFGYANAGIIAGQTIAGMAHDGIDNIPREGTWLLDGGERVLNPNQNKDLTNYLADKKQGGAHITINNNTNAQVNARQNSDGSVTIDVVEKWFNDSMQNPNSTVRKGLAQNTTATARR